MGVGVCAVGNIVRVEYGGCCVMIGILTIKLILIVVGWEVSWV